MQLGWGKDFFDLSLSAPPATTYEQRKWLGRLFLDPAGLIEYLAVFVLSQ